MATDVTREVRAAHEAGHATVYLACSIPVQWVDITPTKLSPSTTRFGFTETSENAWAASANLTKEGKLLRRIVAKAGGLAGETVAGVFDVMKSSKGAQHDISQLGAGLVELGLVPAGAKSTPLPFVAAAIIEATEIIERQRVFFDQLRIDLLARGRVESPTFSESWGAVDEERFLGALEASRDLARQP